MIERLVEQSARKVTRKALMASRCVVLQLLCCLGRKNEQIARPLVPKRIVAVRLDRLGDLVLTLPALDGLADTFPAAQLTVAVRPAFAPLLDMRTGIQKVLTVPSGDSWRELGKKLRYLGADMLVDFSPAGDLMVPRAAAIAEIPIRVGHSGGGREIFLTDPVKSLSGKMSLLEENSSLVEAIGGRRHLGPPDLPLAPEEGKIAEELLRQVGFHPGHLRVAVHPGGYYPSQRYPLERFADVSRRLIERRGGKVVLLGGPADEELTATLHRELGSLSILVTTRNIRQLGAIMSRCDILLANNSGPVHLASAVGLPAVSVMGPTDPARFTPVGRTNRVLRRHDLPCSPCGRGACARHECLRGIPAGDLFNAADEMIEEFHRPAEMIEGDRGA